MSAVIYFKSLFIACFATALWPQSATLPTTSHSPQNAVTVELEVRGFTNTTGQVMVAMYSSELDYSEKKAFRFARGAVSGGQSRFRFDDLKPGWYAIAVFHDQNEDEKLNTTIFGIPKEGFGFSLNPKIGFSKPQWDEVCLNVETNLEATIVLNYLLD
jgi:uncharacterized protein (DUF2141 family)